MNLMNSNKRLLASTIFASVLLFGLIPFVHIQSIYAQLPEVLDLDQIPGGQLAKGIIDNTVDKFTDKGNYLKIDKAVIAKSQDEVHAVLKTHGHIPTDGSGDAFGYGIITSAGVNAIMVSTTHGGVRDSEVQKNNDDPGWHNHYVTLGKDDACGSGPGVKQITFESPGNVHIIGPVATLSHLPATFTGTDALTNKPLTLSPGTDVKEVVSFKLAPKFSGGNLIAVCVTDIQDANKLVTN